MSKAGQLKGWARIGNLDEIRHLAASAGKILSARNCADISVDVVEAADDSVIEALMAIEEASYVPDFRYSRRQFMDFIDEKDSTLLVVSAERKPVGLNLSYNDEEFDEETYFIDDLAVDDGMQGNGIGSALLRLGFVAASRLGYEDTVLYCARTSMNGVDLAQYYRKLGFYQYAPEDDFGIPLCKDLTPEAVAEAISKIGGEDGRT